jgi:hypothetical protein
MRNSLKSLDLFFMKFSASIWGKKKIVQGGCHGCWQTTTEKKRMGAALKSFWSVITETETSFSTILSQGMKLGFPTSPLKASISR